MARAVTSSAGSLSFCEESISPTPKRIVLGAQSIKGVICTFRKIIFVPYAGYALSLYEGNRGNSAYTELNRGPVPAGH